MNACRQLDGLLAEYASGPVEPEEAARLEAHLAGCARCRAELAAYQETFALARLPPPSPAAAGDALGEPAGLARSTWARWSRRSQRHGRTAGFLLGAAAAAALLALVPVLRGDRTPRAPVMQAPVPAAHTERAAPATETASAAAEGAGATATGDDQDEELTAEGIALAAYDAATP
jgi:anti-sigma factor RsiW